MLFSSLARIVTEYRVVDAGDQSAYGLRLMDCWVGSACQTPEPLGLISIVPLARPYTRSATRTQDHCGLNLTFIACYANFIASYLGGREWLVRPSCVST